MSKPRILVISNVLPFPGKSGQEMRVYYNLKSLKSKFHITFLTSLKEGEELDLLKKKLYLHVDDAIVMPLIYDGALVKFFLRVKAVFWMLKTFLKPSNFMIGEIIFTKNRISDALKDLNFDIVLYEYWHCHKTISLFKSRNIPVVLDMHNILWQSYKSSLESRPWIPRMISFYMQKKYRDYEERVWNKYDGIITINQREHDYLLKILPNKKQILFVPMGIDLSKWVSKREFKLPKKIGYYGGLNSARNIDTALNIYNYLMPCIWNKHHDVKLWLIGSSPSKKIKDLAYEDDRVIVTGYVRDIKEILSSMSLVVCPWKGTYGFRSRLIEVMACGVPIVTTSDSISGMGIKGNTEGVFIAESNDEYESYITPLLTDSQLNVNAGNFNKNFIKNHYSFQSTYARLPKFLIELLKKS